MSAQLREWSKYYQEATVAIKERYEEKIKLFGCTEDPYCSFESKGKTAVPASVEWTSWPDVTYPDIYNYLIVTPGMTHEQLKAYKSLDGFNFYINGKVNSVRVTELPCTTTYPKRYLFTALVRHSQTVSAPSLRVWVGVKESGEVICAHCTCMAGAGEVCAHVGALLFTAQGNTEMKRRQSCTSLPCSWLPPRHQFVPAIKVAEIDFKTPKSKQLCRLQSDELDATPSCKACLMTPPSTEQVNKLHVRLSNAVGKPVALSHTPGFSDAYVPLNTLAGFPKPLTELFNRDAIDMSYQDLVEKCSDIYDNYVISCDQVSLVEKNTRQQAKSRIWFQQRAGRVTASKLKSAIATDVMKPSVSLIKSICYPDPTVDRFVSVACSYGLQFEDTARKEYMAAMKEVHIDFEINKSGLIIDPIYPFMGASPDGLICCTCCGHGVLEIKCPFSCKDRELRSVTDENSNFFLYSNDDGKLQLKRNHAYFYQVQMQIKFSQTQYCDFVVWRKDDLFIERIFPDINFIDNALTQAHAFIKRGVLLELVGKWFTKQSTIHVADSHTTVSEVDEVDPYVEATPAPLCCCQSTETEEDAWMIACNNEACVYKWFHYSCVGLTPQTIPDGDWYCPDCRV